MLKKAGMVFAVSALGLLAVSPLAFAGDMHGDWGHEHHGHPSGGPQVNSVDTGGSHSSGLVAIGDINALNDINVCPAIPVGVGIGNLLGILGQGTAALKPSTDDTTCVIDKSIDQDNDH